MEFLSQPRPRPRFFVFARVIGTGSFSARQDGSTLRGNREKLWFVFLATLLLVTPVPTYAQTSREYQIKAVFLFNFAQFTEWPPEAFPDPEAPFVIGLLGTDPFGKTLEETVRDERARGHRIEIRHYRAVEEIKTCHILYISQSEGARL